MLSMTDNELADRLMHVLMNEIQYKADCFDYLCWLNETEQRENVKTAPFLVMASDGVTCWGKTYADAVKVAMRHDKELYDAVKSLVLPEDEPNPTTDSKIKQQETYVKTRMAVRLHSDQIGGSLESED